MEIWRIDKEFWWIKNMKLVKKLKWYEIPLIAWYGYNNGPRIT